MTTMFPVAYHKPKMLLLYLPNPPLPPAAFSSSTLPVHRGIYYGGGGSALPKVRTCHRTVNIFGDSDLTPESLLCPALAMHEVDLEVGAL